MFWNKYPQTNFHELNADWIISKIKELTDTVEEYTALVDAMDTRVTALESGQTSLDNRLSAAESNIGQMMDDMEQMNSRILSHTSQISALQNAAIQDARMIRSIDEADRDAESAGFNYTVDQYTDGVKSTETEQFTMYGATESLAGCLEAADKVKLNKMTASGNDIAFAGKVQSPSAPSSGQDLTNKTYVDSLAISGSAAVSTDSNIYSTAPTAGGATITINSSGGEVRQYGKMIEVEMHANFNCSGNLINGLVICSGTIKSPIYPSWGSKWQVGYVKRLREPGLYNFIPVVIEFGQNGFFTVYLAGEGASTSQALDLYLRFTYTQYVNW